MYAFIPMRNPAGKLICLTPDAVAAALDRGWTRAEPLPAPWPGPHPLPVDRLGLRDVTGWHARED